MTSLDSIKNPVQLRFPARETRAVDARPDTTSTQRQDLTGSGKPVPEKAAQQARETDRAEQLQQLQEASKTIASFVQKVSRELHFSVDADLGKTVVTVVDQNTEQVIRQIPEEEALAMAKYLSEQSLAGVQGVLMTEKA